MRARSFPLVAFNVGEITALASWAMADGAVVFVASQ
jgi:hypothetical protein